ncbi:hypothetical protein K491DRAFT_717074 [Lophiostoma macrostomum CBS 122681]|uniref:Uncharacterized protein n=1 Tax=Lophiostoma macrostomum CBS 122681 TaxID=1314788 RepID=A0A6A6T3X5_9PLEO|nr:hypothetical protein K491DRAFT_717074 [Lophiostoma macrostomum CBS 122681]
MARTVTSKTTSRRERLSASLIFTPKEVKRYIRYQRQTLRGTRDEIGKLPTFTQYAEFQTWREQQECSTSESALFPDPFRLSAELGAHMHGGAVTDAETSSDSDNESGLRIATSCKHALHPASAVAECAKCPCCVVGAHMEYMAKLTAVLDQTDACDRWRMQPGTVEAMVYQAWYAGKLELVKKVYLLEGFAAVESMWSSLHPKASLGEVMSAEKALSLYWTNIEDSQWPAGVPEKQGTIKSGVRFEKGTSFDSGRPQSYFRRGTARYEPGKYSFEEDMYASESNAEENFSAFKFGKQKERDPPAEQGYEKLDEDDEKEYEDETEDEGDGWEEDSIGAEGDYIVLGDD